MDNSEKPAFPRPDSSDKDGLRHSSQEGLTKREYFAGLAMQTYLHDRSGHWTADKIAKEAIRQADELLKQLEIK